MICGKEFPIEQMEPIFTGRIKYRCMDCIAEGDKQVVARHFESHSRGFFKRIEEKEEWRSIKTEILKKYSSSLCYKGSVIFLFG